MYYVPIGLDNSSINIVSGFENTKCKLLFSSTEMFLYELKGNAPQFITKNDLLKIGFEPEGDYYLAFKIKSLTEVKVDGFDLSTIDLSALFGWWKFVIRTFTILNLYPGTWYVF